MSAAIGALREGYPTPRDARVHGAVRSPLRFWVVGLNFKAGAVTLRLVHAPCSFLQLPAALRAVQLRAMA